MIPSSIRNHHFLAKSGPTSHPVGSHGVEPQTFQSPVAMSRINSDSLIAMSEFKTRSRNEDHGSMSTYGLCGTICCCKVGARAGGRLRVSVLMLRLVSPTHSSSRRWAMLMKAAHDVMVCMTMKRLSRVGSGAARPRPAPKVGPLKAVKPVDSAGKCGSSELESASRASPEASSTRREACDGLFLCLLKSFEPGVVCQ